jgi:hypothetical protein
MHARSILTAAVVAAATLALTAPAAQAATVDRFDRSAFDGAPVVTTAGYAMSAATAGELGGHLALSVQAADGSVPAQGQCETADVRAVLTIAPGETFTINTTGELCSHFIDGTPSLHAGFGGRQVSYAGSHKKARVVGDGIIGFKNSFFGAQGSVGLSVRW